MDHLTIIGDKKPPEVAVIQPQGPSQSFLEAQTAHLVLQECEERLEAIYKRSSRSLKDKLYVVLLQLRNVQGEIHQIHPTIGGEILSK